jgi:hypothetical protein
MTPRDQPGQIMRIVLALMGALTLPLSLFNLLGALAALWLAILGRWSLLGWGLAGLIVATPCFRYVLISLLTYRVLHFGELVVATVFSVAMIGCWYMAVLIFFVLRAEPSPLLAVLLLSYATATDPIAFVLFRTRQAPEFGARLALPLFFSQLGYVLGLVATWVWRLNVGCVILGTMTLLGLWMQIVIGKHLHRENALRQSMSI